MKLNGEWFCDNCGEKLTGTWMFEESFGQCICENCWMINDILENWELQNDGIEKFSSVNDLGEER